MKPGAAIHMAAPQFRAGAARFIVPIAMRFQAACQPEDPDRVLQERPPCGRYSSDFIGTNHVFAAIDEGDGNVGLQEWYGDSHMIEDGDLTGYYRLFNCERGDAYGFNEYVSFEGHDPERPETWQVSMEDFVEAARKSGWMQNPQRLVSEARKAGFRPATADQNGPSAEYITCACQHFYPQFSTRTAERVDQ